MVEIQVLEGEVMERSVGEGRVLAVDFGDTRTGLAISDETRFLASGIGYISPGGIERTAEAVAEEARRRGVSVVVVGHPLNMNGTVGPRALRAEEFCRLLGERLPEARVVLFDERMTTMAASRYLNETNLRGKRRKGVIDTLSAQIILQNFLDAEARQGRL